MAPPLRDSPEMEPSRRWKHLLQPFRPAAGGLPADPIQRPVKERSTSTSRSERRLRNSWGSPASCRARSDSMTCKPHRPQPGRQRSSWMPPASCRWRAPLGSQQMKIRSPCGHARLCGRSRAPSICARSRAALPVKTEPADVGTAPPRCHLHQSPPCSSPDPRLPARMAAARTGADQERGSQPQGGAGPTGHPQPQTDVTPAAARSSSPGARFFLLKPPPLPHNAPFLYLDS